MKTRYIVNEIQCLRLIGNVFNNNNNGLCSFKERKKYK